MSNKEDFDWAGFAATPRGQYLISQALHLAIQKLGEVDVEFREVSNISGMQGLLDNLFVLYPSAEKAKSSYLEAAKGA